MTTTNPDTVYIFRSENTADTCNECRRMDGKIFFNKEDLPHLPLHPNCKCHLAPISRSEYENYYSNKMDKTGLIIKEKMSSSYTTEEDTLALKKALIQLGYYEIPSYGLTPYADKAMFDCVERIQKENGIFPSRELRKDDATYKIINDKLRKQGDIISPVFNGKIRNDPSGSGVFGASRNGRQHKGIDIEAKPNTSIISPVSGIVERIGTPYREEQRRDKNFMYKLLVIKDHMGNKHEIYYIEPAVKVGETVYKGDYIGKCQDLQHQYPKETNPYMKNHIHLQVRDKNGIIIDPKDLYPSLTR